MTPRERLELTIREISSECSPGIAARRIAARIEDAICLAVAEEREECAALVEDLCRQCAAAIRARKLTGAPPKA
jgi:hypothetical protein